MIAGFFGTSMGFRDRYLWHLNRYQAIGPRSDAGDPWVITLPPARPQDARDPVEGELVLALVRDAHGVQDARDGHRPGQLLRPAEHLFLPRVLDPPLGLLLGRGRLGRAVEPPRLALPVGGDGLGP